MPGDRDERQGRPLARGMADEHRARAQPSQARPGKAGRDPSWPPHTRTVEPPPSGRLRISTESTAPRPPRCADTLGWISWRSQPGATRRTEPCPSRPRPPPRPRSSRRPVRPIPPPAAGSPPSAWCLPSPALRPCSARSPVAREHGQRCRAHRRGRPVLPAVLVGPHHVWRDPGGAERAGTGHRRPCSGPGPGRQAGDVGRRTDVARRGHAGRRAGGLRGGVLLSQRPVGVARRAARGFQLDRR